MMRRVVFAMAAAIAMLPAFAEDEPSGPSFDCKKASSEVEKTICKDDWLGWFDRQMTKAYAVAKSVPGANADALKGAQTDFLKARNACKGDDDNCIMQAYQHRLAVLAKQVGNPRFTTGDYASDGAVSMR